MDTSDVFLGCLPSPPFSSMTAQLIPYFLIRPLPDHVTMTGRWKSLILPALRLGYFYLACCVGVASNHADNRPGRVGSSSSSMHIDTSIARPNAWKLALSGGWQRLSVTVNSKFITFHTSCRRQRSFLSYSCLLTTRSRIRMSMQSRQSVWKPNSLSSEAWIPRRSVCRYVGDCTYWSILFFRPSVS